MTFTLGLSPINLALLSLVALGLSYWSYRNTIPRLSTGARTVLTGLRFLALFLILFLIFEPILRFDSTTSEPPILAVLIDDSQSISVTSSAQDNSSARPAAAMDAVIDELKNVDFPGRLTFFAFSDSVRALPDIDKQADSLRFSGERTDISRALAFVSETLRGQNLGGVLLLSDGQYNTGRNPIYPAGQYALPIYTVAVGDTLPQRDVQIFRLVTNEIAYAEKEQPVRVTVRASGFGGKRALVSLSRAGAIVSTREVDLPDEAGEVSVDFSVAFPEPGLQQLRATVSHLDGELTYKNNTGSMAVRVLKNKRRVLLFASGPGPDLAAIQQLLKSDETFEVHSFIQKDRSAFYEGAPPDRFDDFDVLVLVGYPGKTAGSDIIARVAAAANSGLPVLFILEPQTDLAALKRSLSGVLPAIPQTIRSGYSEALAVLTPAGFTHPIFDLPGSNVEGMRRLPPVLFNDTRWQPAPDARVLATASIRSVALPDPLFIIGQRGKFRSAALLASGTWRWKYLPDDLSDIDDLWPALFFNAIQWLSTREDDRPLRVRPTESTFTGGMPVEFTGEVYDESLEPVTDASVVVEITQADGSRLPLTMVVGSDGHYALKMGSMPEGTYRYRAKAERNGIVLGTDEGSFVVGALGLEYRETQANTVLLRQLAARSGGQFLGNDAVKQLPSLLAASEVFRPVSIDTSEEIQLWHRIPMLIIILVLLTCEWFLRKRRGMV